MQSLDAGFGSSAIEEVGESRVVIGFGHNALLTAPRVLTESAAFLQIEGEGNSNVIIDGGDLTKAASPLTLHAGAKKTAVKIRR